MSTEQPTTKPRLRLRFSKNVAYNHNQEGWCVEFNGKRTCWYYDSGLAVRMASLLIPTRAAP